MDFDISEEEEALAAKWESDWTTFFNYENLNILPISYSAFKGLPKNKLSALDYNLDGEITKSEYILQQSLIANFEALADSDTATIG